MIVDSTLQAVAAATDQNVLVEIYGPDATPTASGFDPADALKRYATVSGITFAGNAYQKYILSMGRARRTTTEDANTFNVELDNNLDRTVSEFEFATGFEGCIIVVRLISRALSTAIASSLILFAGRCDKPTTGNKQSLPLTAKGILHSVDAEMPRRKFVPEDPEGRVESDPLYEGFRFMPQYGFFTYAKRERRGGFWGLLGFKRTKTYSAQWSSFSDLDAERYVSEVLGRAQVAGVHVAYADVGINVLMTTIFCEGQIAAMSIPRSDDARLPISDHPTAIRLGELGNVGAQIPHTNTAFPGNGYYSRSALFFGTATGTGVDEVDSAPLVFTTILGRLMTIPASDGDWDNTNKFSDNGAAHARFVLTSPDYYNLNAAWLDDTSFLETYRYNDGIIFDTANSDILFLPDTVNFDAVSTQAGHFLLSTGNASANWFKYLNGTVTAAATFLQTPYLNLYDTAQIVPIEPEPPGGNPPPGGGATASLKFFLRRRYTSNVVITEKIALVDFLHKILFPASRMFITQGSNGKLKLKNKKPVDWGLGTAALSGTTIAVDDISAWVTDKRGFALVDPHTTNSEVRTVTDANYSTAANSVTITVSADLSKTNFSGCDGGSTPATGTITVNAVTAAAVNTITIDGTSFDYVAGTLDTVASAAGFIYGTINGHPILGRKYIATWSAGSAVVTIKSKYGDLVLDSALAQTHVAPLANPTTAPTLTPAGSGALAAGDYIVAYSDVNARGETLLAATATTTLTANQKITVSSLSLASGATARNWYVSPVAGSSKLRLHLTRTVGTSFDINSLPSLSDGLIPDTNRTGCEVMRVEAVFTDRSETRSAATRSNVIKASFGWKLGNREKPTNRVDLKYRDSTQDFRLVELRLKDEAHYAKTKNWNPLAIDGSAIDNYHQAYRIASGVMAERRDADFFYTWQSDKTAVLLEEGDVVAITDDGSQVYNFPVRIESMEFEQEKGLVTVNFLARQYSTTLYDDSVAERHIPVVVENSLGMDYV